MITHVPDEDFVPCSVDRFIRDRPVEASDPRHRSLGVTGIGDVPSSIPIEGRIHERHIQYRLGREEERRNEIDLPGAALTS